MSHSPIAQSRDQERLVELVTRLREPFDCPVCEGTGDVIDENWQPEFGGDTRRYGSGIIDCGFCEDGKRFIHDMDRDVALLLADVVAGVAEIHGDYDGICTCGKRQPCPDLIAWRPLCDRLGVAQ